MRLDLKDKHRVPQGQTPGSRKCGRVKAWCLKKTLLVIFPQMFTGLLKHKENVAPCVMCGRLLWNRVIPRGLHFQQQEEARGVQHSTGPGVPVLAGVYI